MDRNIDPIEVLKYAKENDLVRCDIGVKTYSLLSIVAKDYRLNIKTISLHENYLRMLYLLKKAAMPIHKLKQ